VPRLPTALRRRLRGVLFRRGRTPGLRTAKTTLAAVLSFVVADLLGTSATPVLAPLTALLVVQLTMYETFRHGLERIFSVLAGVLVAVGVASVVGLTWWSLGAVIALSLVVGRALRLGPHLLEVPISAMLVLAVTNAEDLAVERVYETLIGSAVGVLVNLVIAPPLYMQPAGDALAELADRMAAVLRGLAAQLREDWSRLAADHWLDESRALGAEVARADETLARAEQSARLNPRGRAVRRGQPRVRAALTGLEHVHVSLRGLARGLLDRTYFVPVEQQAQAYGEDARRALADVLDAAADAVWEIGEVARTSRPEDARRRVERQLADLERRQARLSRLLVVDPAADPAAWQQHGAVLAAVDRLRVEVAAAANPADGEWHPPPLTARRRRVGSGVLSGRGRRGR
jgi:uncharacterized membrane protein YgaE (UPF0421/DUF939 family)